MKTASFEQVLAQPGQVAQRPPCAAGCAAGGDVRSWINIIAQRRKLGLSDADAYARAWRVVTEVNPFPATLGRICPHPCESGCNRAGKDGAVAINALERFLGDWGLQQRLGLQRIEAEAKPEWIGVIGGGPAGLSFAYQMARRGYRVTIYEKNAKAGGMLQYGIPEYRLPEDVLRVEIDRILELGIELKLNTVVGRDVTVAELKARHAVLFLGVGAHRAHALGIPGEEGGAVCSGTDYLARVNRGEPPALGGDIFVIGGGNTAIDAARTARRTGARVTLLYRRTRDEMPAIAAEIDDALAEGVALELLVAPVRVLRDGQAVAGLVVQRMQLGDADASGRRRPVPIAGSEFEVAASAVIAAVSQEPDWEGMDELHGDATWIRRTADGRIDGQLWAGGDAFGLGIAGVAIANGRRAAEALHAELRRLAAPAAAAQNAIASGSIRSDYYAEGHRAEAPELPVAERLAAPQAEVRATIGEAEFLDEVARCFSCGLCFGCEQCYMYCNGGGFARLEQPAPGAYFALKLDACEGCRKCIELCPCGFLSAQPMGQPAGRPGEGAGKGSATASPVSPST